LSRISDINTYNRNVTKGVFITSNFKEFYKGLECEYKEDEYLLKTLKRQITSYLKETSLERLHGIFNKIFILRKNFDKHKFYDILLDDLNNEEKENFLKFLLSEGFNDINEEKFEGKSIWQKQLDLVLKKYRIK